MFTQRTVEPALTVIFAGRNVFFEMMMVFSETEAVHEGEITAVVTGVFTGAGVVSTVAGVGDAAGCTGGDPVHPQARTRMSAITGRTRTGFIQAGRRCAFNKLMAASATGGLPYRGCRRFRIG